MADTASSVAERMTKQVGVGPLQASILTWISGGILVVSLIFHIVAIALPEWGFGILPYAGFIRTAKIGLWKACFVEGCDSIISNDALRASQAFSILALLLMLGAVAVTMVYASPVTIELLRYIMIAARATTALFLLITFTVFTAVASSFGPSFGLEIVAFLLEIIGTVLLSVDLILSRRE